MLDTLLNNPNKAGRDEIVYGKLRDYIYEKLKSCPPIELAYTDNEPFETVEEYIADCQTNNRNLIWHKHFETKHSHLTPEEYGLWRGIHDYFGHLETFTETKGVKGQFNLRGEVEQLYTVALDCKCIDVVEAVVLETIIRNLDGGMEVLHCTNRTNQLAQMVMKKIFCPVNLTNKKTHGKVQK